MCQPLLSFQESLDRSETSLKIKLLLLLLSIHQAVRKLSDLYVISLSLSARSRLQICCGSPVETHFFFTATIFFSQTFLRSLARQLSCCRVILCSRVPQREVLAHGHTVEDFSFWRADTRLSLDVWSLSWSKTIIDCFRPDLTELCLFLFL